MKRLWTVLALVSTLAGCAWLNNPDAGEPEVVGTSQRPVADIVTCLKREAIAHHANVRQSPLPQGVMLDFGASNIVKIRTDDTGRTSYRYYPGERSVGSGWINDATRGCAPL